MKQRRPSIGRVWCDRRGDRTYSLKMYSYSVVFLKEADLDISVILSWAVKAAPRYLSTLFQLISNPRTFLRQEMETADDAIMGRAFGFVFMTTMLTTLLAYIARLWENPRSFPRPGASPQSPISEAEHKAASVPKLKSP